MPFEITELVDHEFRSTKFTTECTTAYLDTVRDFISENVVDKLAKERTSRGMFDALQRGDEWDEDIDLSMGASGLCLNRYLNLVAGTDFCYLL